jgi:hypothetical protein
MGLTVLIITNDVVTTEDVKHMQWALSGVLDPGRCRRSAARRDYSF